MAYYKYSNTARYEAFLPAEEREKLYEERAAKLRTPKVHQFPVQNTNINKNTKRRTGFNMSVFTKIAVAATFVILLCLNLNLRVQIYDVKSEIGAKEKEYAKLEGERVRLNMEIENIINYKNLEEAAAELGMQKIEKRQIRYIEQDIESSAEIFKSNDKAEYIKAIAK